MTGANPSLPRDMDLPPDHSRRQLLPSPRGGAGGGCGDDDDNRNICMAAGQVEEMGPGKEEDSSGRWWSADVYSSDEFRMYEFKVRRCMRIRNHDWTECPFAHPGEKARRRDPRWYHYSGTVCPSFRRDGHCGRGDACEFSHGVFECWLHPSRYRTMPCKDGRSCRRKVCFFAHTPSQLRPATVTTSFRKMRCIFLPKPQSLDSGGSSSSSPTSALSGFPCPSPPLSPTCGHVTVTARNHGVESTTTLEMYYSTYAEVVKSMEAMDLGSAPTLGLFWPSSANNASASPAPEEDGPDLDWVIELVM